MLDPGVGWRTRRLQIEPLLAENAVELFAVLDDPALHEFIGGSPLSLQELTARYERLATRRSPDATQVWANWLVREQATGLAVGTLQATLPSDGPESGEAELAWVIGRPWQGRGFAAEAVISLVGKLHDGWEVVAHIHPDHIASQRVARAAGLGPTDVVIAGETRWERTRAEEA
jgi:RimJ/RimL family protein N-acetyltransferase